MSHWLWWLLYFLGHGILNSFACHHFLIVFHYPTCHLRGPGLCAKQSPLKKWLCVPWTAGAFQVSHSHQTFLLPHPSSSIGKNLQLPLHCSPHSLTLTSFSFTYNNVRKKRAVYRWAKLTTLRFGLRSNPVLHCTSLLCIVWHMITAHENGSIFFIAEPNQRCNYFSFLKSKYSDLSFFGLFPTE